MSHADNNNELARLKVSPPLAWPTIAILIVSLISIALSWVLVMNDIWPLWLGMVINSIAGYALFTPAHEAIHRAAAQKLALSSMLVLRFRKRWRRSLNTST